MILRRQLEYLKDWKLRKTRKPLILRGARQVGKTKLAVDIFGKSCFDTVVEINFEFTPEMSGYFSSKDPDRIIPLLEAVTGKRIVDGQTLLFLDEVQDAPEVLVALRYFYEKRPSLHVIAAGSLLEFALEEFEYSIPVGRVEYLYMEPLSFEEFLTAIGASGLSDWISGYSMGDEVPQPLHAELMEKVRLYWMVGGLPEAVQAFSETNSFLEVERIQESLIATYLEDFAKYRKRVPLEMLQRVFSSIPLQIGKKFSYVKVDRDSKARDIGAAMELLRKAMVLTRVNRSTAEGLPLGAGEDHRNFKTFALDVGLCAHQLGMSIADLAFPIDDDFMASRGGVCEQFVAEELKCHMPEHTEHILYHWSRDKKGSDAEVDFLLQHRTDILPVEVKAGATGSMKSLHQYLLEKQQEFGVRINGDRPSFINTEFVDHEGLSHPFRLLSLPFYMIGRIHDLVEQVNVPGFRTVKP